ncbi:MAG: nitrogen regulatory IIA protein [Sphingobacteriaceae bacterium]|nr:nitrogen regulatory IIA protein [Sphingobacteriaceae bacterium]
MKKLKIIFHAYEARIERWWQKQSTGKQRRFVILFFACYLLLTGCVILTVWYEAKADDKKRKNEIEHIRNPLLQTKKQFGDSSSILNNKNYERN